MSKRVEQMTGLEVIDTIVDALEIMSMLEFGEDSDDDDMKACAEEYGMVGLPRDADGEPIHIGDMMALNDDCAFYVEEMHLVSSDKDGCMWLVSNNAGSLVKSDMLHHVPEDTIEGILMEAVMRAHCDTLADKGGTDVTDLLERLRDLMGDSDER